MDISRKTILLTGGTAGIGRELALQLRDMGAEVVITGRNPDRLTEMRALGFEAIAADLSNASGVDALVAEWGERPLDILINNAGQLIAHDFRKGDTDADHADAGIYTNFNAPIRLTTALIDQLKARPEALIVNITSGLALAPAARQPIYSATKSALRFYSLTLREQLRKTNVRVLEALPPVVDTQMNDGNPVKKMSPQKCAADIVTAIEKGKDEAFIGQSNLLRRVLGISPALAHKLVLRF